jgi:sugar phosphate isomerase/epimerase
MRTLSLAAGVMTDIGPVEMVEVSAAAGWPACGIWYDHSTWTSQTTREVRRRMADTGLSVLDMEPIIPSDGRADNGEALIDAAADIGAPFVLFASRLSDTAASVERFRRLCEHARPAGVTVVCEFLPIFPVNTLDLAVEIVRCSEARNAGVLVDNLHLSRSGGTVNDVKDLGTVLFPYVQIADAPMTIPTTPADLAWEAMKGRSCPGEGALPIAELLAALPEVPISFEIRSEKLLEDFPDPVERAAHVWSTSRLLG